MMNDYQRELYDQLMVLCAEREAFFYKDFDVRGHTFRIFNYRLASYSDFCEPGSLECRGIMFKMDGDEPFALASLPMEKFFNLNENPFTMTLDLSTIVEAESKADGSLISTYSSYGDLMLKTKGSTESDQCIAAMAFLERPANRAFRDQIHSIVSSGYTVNLEWCAPDNRIVLPYAERQLIVLNIRRHSDGEYVQPEDLFEEFVFDVDEIELRWTERMMVSDWDVWANHLVPNETGVEGYVVRMASGQRVKIKTPWYLALHHTKDSINSPRRLFEAVLEEATDDMRSLFHDDPVAISMILEMEKFVDRIYNHLVDSVERFYERNKEMERKDYAILGQQELDKMAFGCAMQKYTGRQPDYKDLLKRKWKELGLKDREENDDE